MLGRPRTCAIVYFWRTNDNCMDHVAGDPRSKYTASYPSDIANKAKLTYLLPDAGMVTVLSIEQSSLHVCAILS